MIPKYPVLVTGLRALLYGAALAVVEPIDASAAAERQPPPRAKP
jgi:hypothetical protein